MSPTVPTKLDLITPGMWITEGDKVMPPGGLTLARVEDGWVVGVWITRLRTRTIPSTRIHWCDDANCPANPRYDLRTTRTLFRRLLETDGTRTTGRTDRDRDRANWARTLHAILNEAHAL